MEHILPIAIPQGQLAEFCQRHHIRKLSLFGSVLRDDFTDQSDVDFLVEFERGKVPGYIRLVGMEKLPEDDHRVLLRESGRLEIYTGLGSGDWNMLYSSGSLSAVFYIFAAYTE